MSESKKPVKARDSAMGLAQVLICFLEAWEDLQEARRRAPEYTGQFTREHFYADEQDHFNRAADDLEDAVVRASMTVEGKRRALAAKVCGPWVKHDDTDYAKCLRTFSSTCMVRCTPSEDGFDAPVVRVYKRSKPSEPVAETFCLADEAEFEEAMALYERELARWDEEPWTWEVRWHDDNYLATAASREDAMGDADGWLQVQGWRLEVE